MASYLTPHGPGYRYQRPVPKDLQPLVGRRFWKKYIRDCSKAEAQAKARIYATHHGRVIDTLRALPENQRRQLAQDGGLGALPDLEKMSEPLPRSALTPRTLAQLTGWSEAEAALKLYVRNSDLDPDPTLVAQRDCVRAIASQLQPIGDRSWEALFETWKDKSGARRHKNHATSLGLMRKCFGERDYTTITPHDAERFLKWMESEGVSKGQQLKHRENASGMFSRVVPLQMTVHPFRSVKVAGKYTKAKKNPYTGEEVGHILRMAAEPGIGREYRKESLWCIRLEAFMGCRINEAAQLQRGDVTVKGGVPVIHFRSIDAVTERRHPQKTIRTGEDRVCALHPALWDAIYQRKHKLPVEDFRTYVGLNKNNGSEFVFAAFEYKDPNDGGKGRGEYLINNLGRFVRDVCGITRPNIQPNHAFRHRFNDAMRNAGWDKDKREAFLGQGGSVNRRYGDGPSLAKISKELRDVNPLSDL
jgi:integrase